MNLIPQQLQLSKSISLYLRHDPSKLGIVLDLEGWTDLDEFCSKLSNKFKTEVNEEIINNIVTNSPKKRFEIDSSRRLIRAKYGHSVEVNPEYKLLTKSITLYHGTPNENIESIKKTGLQPRARQFVHLASDYNLAVLTAKRWSKDYTILEIQSEDLLNDGIEIYDTGDDIYLIKSIESKYIKF